MPVATKGAVKWVSNQELERAGTECIICNAYIFSIRPGLETVEKLGGIHGFIGWKRGIFTDSGGFQTLSKSFLIKAGEEGVHLLALGRHHAHSPRLAGQRRDGNEVVFLEELDGLRATVDKKRSRWILAGDQRIHNNFPRSDEKVFRL